MSKPLTAQHSEWLSLVEVSGPFLTLPVLKRALPMGLDPTPLPLVDDLRVAWKEVGDDESLTPRWIRWVLSDLLELPDEVLKEGTAIGPAFTHTVPEHSVRLRPDFVVVDPDAPSDATARLLVTLLPAGTELDERLPDSKWSADAVDRMAELCRGTRVRLGLVTNGDQWALVDAPIAGPTGVATWDANLWLEERITLDAFTTLLGVRRFFSVAPEDTLEALLAESANAEAEVTDQLGRQVRQAVELLVDAMSRANRDRGGHLFDDLSAEQVYEAAVTVMMRLVFLLSAEERGLFLLGDETYDSTYAVSTLRGQLQEEANTYGEEVIARRTDAWHRLLATFRMVYGGAQHENLRLPAYGGSLFDPDRFPILEGRKADESWRSSPSHPLPIDNRTVLHILGALQVLTFKDRRGVKEARRLSFRALDVEQIGHVYEGLLDHSAVRVDEVAVGLGGKKEPEVALELIEAAAERGRDHLASSLADLTGLSVKAVNKALSTESASVELERLISACDNDPNLADRIAPFLGVMRTDLADLPTVYLPDSMYVTQSSDRRSSGTYYTPRALAEEVVHHALEPLVYEPGPSTGVEPAGKHLKRSADLLELRVCDLAMGSGAFLVAACRYLSARLLEAWETEGFDAGDSILWSDNGAVKMTIEAEDREILARRLVADSCLYGVDRNPMAVEMAKLSMWLITLAKDRPFTFVDHALRCGDSTLGITDLRQLECFHLNASEGAELHRGTLFDPATRVEPLVREALKKRRQLESFPVLDVEDAERKQRLLRDTTAVLAQLKVVADLVVGAALATASSGRETYARRLLSVATEVEAALDPNRSDEDREQRTFDLSLKAGYWLDEDRPSGVPDRRCHHWPLEFPEVFLREGRNGFDAIVGNPPFVGDAKLLDAIGRSHRELLVQFVAGGVRGRTDLVAFFLHRAVSLLAVSGATGLITTDTIAQGDTREVGLQALLDRSDLQMTRAVSSRPWPGGSHVDVSLLWMWRGDWKGMVNLDGLIVDYISPYLSSGAADNRAPERLARNRDIAFLGSKIDGIGFLLTPDQAADLLDREPVAADVVFPFLNGDDLVSTPDQKAKRYVIDFADRTLEQAEEYPEALAIVRREVKPYRDGLKRKAYRERWWRFTERGVNLYKAIDERRLEEVIAVARVSKHARFCRVPTAQVFSEKVVVVTSDSDSLYGLLSSEIHRCWAVKYSSTRGSTVNYTPTDCLQTFPISAANLDSVELGSAGRLLWSTSRELMEDRAIGVTGLFNLVNDEQISDAEIVGLRGIQQRIEECVAQGYGWSDGIGGGLGFHPSKQGIRFTLCAEHQSVVLERLFQLNQDMHTGESNVPGTSEPAGASSRRFEAEGQLSLGEVLDGP